ncbi:MAG: tryptophan synthase subunit alpha [Bacteroidales bacterium]
MDNRIDLLFEQKSRNVLSLFFTAGFPEVESTPEILAALQANGIDMAEIGIPFSDPMADGPVIQASSTVALRNGMTLRRLFGQLERVRESVTMPLLLMGYLNPILQFGFESFCSECQRVGVDGVIIPDLPFHDYMANYRAIAQRYHLKMIMLITPETSDERIRMIDAHTGGFIYMVSSASTTGAKDRFSDENLHYFSRIAAMGLQNRTLIGFGISNRTTFDAALANSSGAIVGSRFVSLLQEEPTADAAVKKLLALLRG